MDDKQPDHKLCDCMTMAGMIGPFIFDHHDNCAKFDPQGDMLRTIKSLCKGIESWAADEDGVHPDCWEAYRSAKSRMGERVKDESDE